MSWPFGRLFFKVINNQVNTDRHNELSLQLNDSRSFLPEQAPLQEFPILYFYSLEKALHKRLLVFMEISGWPRHTGNPGCRAHIGKKNGVRVLVNQTELEYRIRVGEDWSWREREGVRAPSGLFGCDIAPRLSNSAWASVMTLS
jgi:hypothetical protein